MKHTLKYAFNGLHWAFSHHRNFQIHAAISLFVLSAALLLRISRVEFIIIIFTILLGFIVEMVNTSIEEITDLITVKWAHQAKIAKDVAAGMVLLTSAGAALVGMLIFAPYLYKMLQ
jgi:diacylglycerol kinase